MRFQLWAYKQDGYIKLAVRDREFNLSRGGSVLMRDQSSYSKDAGKFVWKNASFPAAVWSAIRRGKGVKIAEAMHIDALDANMQYNLINYLWESQDELPAKR